MSVRKYLVDSNLIVYPLDDKDAAKQARAEEVLRVLLRQESAVFSSQTLSEFANVTLNKMRIPPDRVYSQVERYERLYPIYPLTPTIVLEAVRGVRDYGLSYYDAQIWAVAKLNQIPIVLSEDFNTGGGLEGVTFLDPLEPAFDPAGL